MGYKTKLTWKIIARLTPASPDYSKRNKFFNTQTGNGIIRQIAGGLVSNFSPVVLAPTSVFHAALEKDKGAYGLSGKKFPYRLAQDRSPGGVELDVNVAIHLYNNRCLVIGFELDHFELTGPLTSLMELRSFREYDSLLWLARRVIQIVVAGNASSSLLADVPSALPCVSIAVEPGLPAVSEEIAVEAVTGHRAPSSLVIQNVIAKNAGHQTVRDGLLLLDKQGIFFTFPSNTSVPGQYGPERLFSSATAMMELAAAAANLASSDESSRTFTAGQLETLHAMLQQPSIALHKSVSAQRLWTLIARELQLPGLLSRIPAVPAAELSPDSAPPPPTPPTPPEPKPIALIMKGGGVKGLALAGAVVELQKYYTFSTYVGTSAGAIAAVMLAAGMSGDELLDHLKKKNFQDFVSENIFSKLANFMLRDGLHRGDHFVQWLNELLAEKIPQQQRIELRHLPRRAVVYAANADKGTVTFDSTGENRNSPADFAVRCSMSIPYVFVPQRHHGSPIYDGGLLNNFPVKTFTDASPEMDFIALYLVSSKAAATGSRTLFGELIDIITGRDEKAVADEHKARTVLIDPAPIKTTDFSLSETEKEFLVLQGRLSALTFIGRQLSKESELMDDILGLTRKCAVLTTRIHHERRNAKLKRWGLRLFTIACVSGGWMIWNKFISFPYI